MKKLRTFLGASIFLICLLIIGWLFWVQEVQYSLPTPIPEDFELVLVDTRIEIGDTISERLKRPAFYHFFQADCPCSRFNLDHFNDLKDEYAKYIDFYVVVEEGSDLSEAQKYFRGQTRLLEDKNKAYANKCGVYSTPQAVIIDTDRKLYFRGNYNRARYCIDPASNFAQMAVDSLILGRSAPSFGPLATIAYGCGIEPKEPDILTQLSKWKN